MKRRRLFRGICWFTCLSLVAFSVIALQGAIEKSRSVARHVDSLGHLSQIRLALFQYEDDYGQLPPAVVYAGDGRHPHSWRVLLLPYLSRNDLYEMYNFDEPWDGPGNRMLIERVPLAYALSDAEAASGRSGILAVTGENTVFGAKNPMVPDADTVAFIEAQKIAPLWTMPKDITKEELVAFSRNGRLGVLSHSGYKLAVLSLGPVARTLGLLLDEGPKELAESVTVPDQ